MMEHYPEFGLPLLTRELVELSSRRRTYQVRVIYAAIVLLISWIVLFAMIPSGARSPLDVLGTGLAVMGVISYLQDLGLHLVLPAVACGAFTIEKERNTLGLLFLTRLGPWTILFEKLLSRLILAGSFLIISLPVLGFCYALGGITVDHLLSQFYAQFFLAITIVSMSIFCSTWFRTTSGALIGTYLLIYLTRTTLFVLWPWITAGRAPSWELVWTIITLGSLTIDTGPITNGYVRSWAMLVTSIPWLLTAGLCVLLARRFLVRRAFLAATNPLRSAFKRLDWLFDRANKNAFTRGIVLIRPSERLPELDAVAWRETTTRSLGQARYLIRMLVVVEAPVLVALLRYMLIGDWDALKVFTFFTEIVTWIGMTLITCVVGAGLISGERSRQTLDVLLTSPMKGRDIIRQKLAGLKRLIWICQTPIWTCLMFRMLIEFDMEYLINKVSILLIYPPAVAWIAMWHGLRAKTSVGAVVRALLSVLVRCLGPFLVLYVIVIIIESNMGMNSNSVEDYFEFVMSVVSLVSPLTFVAVAEFYKEIGPNDDLWAFRFPAGVILNSIFHGGVLFWIRSKCLNRADERLGRIRDEP